MAPPLPAAARLGIRCRAMTDADRPFIEALFAATRADMFASLPAEQQRAILAQQHQAQDRHYRSVYPDAEWLILEQGAKPVGRLYLDNAGPIVSIIDLSLLPEARGRGIGTALLADTLAAAAATGKIVRLHVERHNPALRLYQRLGFRIVADDQVYLRMEWRPESAGPA